MISSCSPGYYEWHYHNDGSNEENAPSQQYSLSRGVIEKFNGTYCNLVIHDGVLYCSGKEGKVSVFQPSGKLSEDGDWKVIPGGIMAGVPPSHTRGFIAEHSREILLTSVTRLGDHLSVYRLDCRKMKWTKLDSLGEKTLYLSHTRSILVSAGAKGMKNRIYFPRFKGKDMFIIPSRLVGITLLIVAIHVKIGQTQAKISFALGLNRCR
ncbi:hypothetical protein GIB67_009679 [Kingdonia uniflora]|uniref:KIB1-4 beta-propeller domain-containing protein n=1 Tax=Kingdonia uniflora TaxID=39325 RepID=A0A7J7LBB1_9MAGN|nr:hypothetical protein GIB67_009679 [Kingdonia uniflora]